MRWVTVIVLAVAALTLPAGGASGSCAGPQLSTDSVVRTGAPLTVRGEYFVDGCDDTGGGRVGCSGPPAHESEEVSMRDVEIRLTQGIHSWVLGTEGATHEGVAVWRVQLPPDVRRGPARLTAATAQLRVTVG